MADYTKAFEVDDGLIIAGASGLFSGSLAPDFDAPLGSLYLKSDGTRYIKTAFGTGAETWTLEVPSAGVANALTTTVYNQSGASIPKGSVIYLNGSHGFLPKIFLAKADAEATSSKTYGITTADIADNDSGQVVQAGLISNLATHLLTEGNRLYLSPTTAGGFTETKPSAPNHAVFIGVCTRSHPTFGTIQVSIINGFEVDELHDVSSVTPANNDLLIFNSSTNLWTNGRLTENNAMGMRTIPDDGKVYRIGANFESIITRRGFINGRLYLDGRLTILF